ncbi:MAG: hypothetical protein MH137_04500 [Flavobacteriales bacterium]|nr:hypothetical protein [Flavobacteriales bacterium]
METKRIMMAVFLIFSFTGLLGQNAETGRKGMVLFQGNLAGGYRFAPGIFTAYVQGDTDWFLHDRVTLGGQVWYHIPIRSDVLKHNHSVFAGIAVHPVKTGRIDPFIGFHPGASLVGERNNALSVIPVMSASAGVNIYTGPLFHLFLKVQGVAGNFNGREQTSQPLHELRFSAGLAYHFRLKTKKSS